MDILRALLASSLLVVTLSGCETVKNLMGKAGAAIVAQIVANVPGEYTVKIAQDPTDPSIWTSTAMKDGKVMFADRWKCAGLVAGKLEGCSKL